jgi:hypothetical protein
MSDAAGGTSTPETHKSHHPPYPPPTTSGAGFLMPFFLGVIDLLYNELGILKYSTPNAGSSAGSITLA